MARRAWAYVTVDEQAMVTVAARVGPSRVSPRSRTLADSLPDAAPLTRPQDVDTLLEGVLPSGWDPTELVPHLVVGWRLAAWEADGFGGRLVEFRPLREATADIVPETIALLSAHGFGRPNLHAIRAIARGFTRGRAQYVVDGVDVPAPPMY